MTIDEAIEQFKYDAECNRADLDLSYAEDNEQVAEWLEELKELREYFNSTEIGKYRFQKGYKKAIDDFAILMKETLNHDWASTKISEQIIYNRLFDKCNEIAEQLKAGVKYEM